MFSSGAPRGVVVVEERKKERKRRRDYLAKVQVVRFEANSLTAHLYTSACEVFKLTADL
jgi:hypothetical protein